MRIFSFLLIVVIPLPLDLIYNSGRPSKQEFQHSRPSTLQRAELPLSSGVNLHLIITIPCFAAPVLSENHTMVCPLTAKTQWTL
jgi:hypothetical protein